MLVDLLYCLLDKSQSALLILPLVRIVSRSVVLRNATQRQHAAETAYRKGATTETEQKNPVSWFIVFDECCVAVLYILRNSEAGRPAGEIIGPTPPLALVLRTQPLVVKGHLLSRISLLRRIPELPHIAALRFRHASALARAVGEYHDVLHHLAPALLLGRWPNNTVQSSLILYILDFLDLDLLLLLCHLRRLWQAEAQYSPIKLRLNFRRVGIERQGNRSAERAKAALHHVPVLILVLLVALGPFLAADGQHPIGECYVEIPLVDAWQFCSHPLTARPLPR